MSLSRDSILEELCGGEVSHCVVLSPAGASPSPVLTARLAAEDAEVVTTADPVLAMSQAALLERLHSSRAAWGLGAACRIALILDRPDDTPEVDDLLAACGRYLDCVTVLAHEGDAEQPWRVATPPGRSARAPGPTGAEGSLETEGRAGGPSADSRGAYPFPGQHEIAQESPAHTEERRAASADETRADPDEQPAISREELAMLLRADDEDDLEDAES